MKISINSLKQMISGLPNDTNALQNLFDDVGLEVKHVEQGSDLVFTLELLANRGDHHCYTGVARELYARLESSELKPLGVKSLKQTALPIAIQVETERCFAYGASYFEITKTPPAFPEEIIYPLGLEDITPSDALVDVTNFVNLELGQPLHAFDAERIKGTIKVRESLQGEKARPLGHEEAITLPANIMVIADEEKILAIAGVIGCEESKVTADTRKVLLESACFDPVAVRKASQQLKIRTHASKRFEKGSDGALVITALERAAYLLEKFCQVKIEEANLAKPFSRTLPELSLSVSACNAYFASHYELAKLKKIFTRYGFTVTQKDANTLAILVPASRLWDVVRVEDLYEEVARAIGYNALPSNVYVGDIHRQPDAQEMLIDKIETLLLAQGFYEHFTEAFYSNKMLEKLGINEEHPLYKHIQINNALERRYSFLKNNTIAHALEAVYANVCLGTRELKIYEWTRSFHAVNQACQERYTLWGILTGSVEPANWQVESQAVDVFYLKGLIAQIAALTGIPLVCAELAKESSIAGFFHPYRRMGIYLENKLVGVLGELEPQLCQRFDLKKIIPCYFELYYQELLSYKAAKKPVIEMPPELPPIERALSFSVPERFQSNQIIDCINSLNLSVLNNVEVVDRFCFDEEGASRVSLTYRIEFANHFGLTAEKINAWCGKIIEAVQQRFVSDKVKLR